MILIHKSAIVYAKHAYDDVFVLFIANIFIRPADVLSGVTTVLAHKLQSKVADQ